MSEGQSTIDNLSSKLAQIVKAKEKLVEELAITNANLDQEIILKLCILTSISSLDGLKERGEVS